MSRTNIIIVIVVLASAAGWGAGRWLSQEPSVPEPLVDVQPARVPTVSEPTINESARPVNDFDTLHEGLRVSGYARDEIMAQGGSAIPVLIPFEMTRDAATAQQHHFVLKIALQGYTAILADAALDYVINGTTHGYARSEETRDGAAPPDPGHENPDREDGDYMMPYEDFDDGRGGSLSFGFRGADYQVELYCRAEAPDPTANCLKAEDVEAFVHGLTSTIAEQ